MINSLRLISYVVTIMQNNRSAVRIWDLPTRIFHWALVLSIVGAFVSVKLGGLYMEWHLRFGLLALGLIIFRVVWGLIGSRYARFSQFVRGPGAILNYLKGASASAGHNPLGALSVIGLLAIIGFQAVSGLFTTDKIMTQGPLYAHVSESVASTLTWLHKLNEWVIIGFISLHLVAILWYSLVRRKSLVPAMISGNAQAKDVPSGTVPAQDDISVWIRALILAACVTALIFWIRSLEVVGDFSFS
jgi:cytochrome b